jgi:hypothetical protein
MWLRIIEWWVWVDLELLLGGVATGAAEGGARLESTSHVSGMLATVVEKNADAKLHTGFHSCT